MNVETWHRLGVVGLKVAFSHGELNPVAHLSHILDHIDRTNPALNAIAQLDRFGAEQSAHESAGHYRLNTQRALESVPVVVASGVAVKGLDQTAGLAARRGMIAVEDAGIVATLRSAGANIIGTASMDEAGLDMGGASLSSGRTYNPHGDGCAPGGPMGGCAVAVASGMALAAVGNDALGGMRLAATGCGIFALRPSRGTCSTVGMTALNPSFDSAGFVARSMDDLYATVTAGCSINVSAALNSFSFATLANMGGSAVHEDMASFYHYALSLLPEVPRALDLPAPLATIAEAAAHYADWTLAGALAELGEERCAALSPMINRRIHTALSRTRDALLDDVDVLRISGQALRAHIGNDLILLTPATAGPASAHGAPPKPGCADFAVLADVSGLPAITFPAGLTRDKMPLGLQLIGPQGSEALLMAQARMLSDRMRGYHPPAQWW